MNRDFVQFFEDGTTIKIRSHEHQKCKYFIKLTMLLQKRYHCNVNCKSRSISSPNRDKYAKVAYQIGHDQTRHPIL